MLQKVSDLRQRLHGCFYSRKNYVIKRQSRILVTYVIAPNNSAYFTSEQSTWTQKVDKTSAEKMFVFLQSTSFRNFTSFAKFPRHDRYFDASTGVSQKSNRLPVMESRDLVSVKWWDESRDPFETWSQLSDHLETWSQLSDRDESRDPFLRVSVSMVSGLVSVSGVSGLETLNTERNGLLKFL